MKNKLKEKLKGKIKEEEKKIKKTLSEFAKENPNLEGDWETEYPNLGLNDLDTEEDEVEEFSTLLPIEYALELKLKDIKKALKKMEEGDYGICEDCNEKIEEARLRASPEAQKCINCITND
ncbi:MAG: TraR/DksA family transcriptional regulator [Minisyncoccales bacterium]